MMHALQSTALPKILNLINIKQVYYRIMSETFNNVNKLYAAMDLLQQAINRVSDGWNDTVSSAINVNHINVIIQRCNEINTRIYNEAHTADQHLSSLQRLLSES